MTPESPLRPHPTVASADILVVGAGIVGMATAGHLAKSGLEVATIDGGYAGGTTANAGSLHVQMQSAFMQRFPHLVQRLESSLHLHRKATRYWQDFQNELGVDCEVNISGGLMVAEDFKQFAFLREKVQRERKVGLDSHLLDRAELGRLAPYLGPSVVGAEFCPHEGKVNPLLANAAMRRWLTRLGVVSVWQEPVLSLEPTRRGVLALTDKGHVIRAGKVVLAAGYMTRGLVAPFGFKLPAIGVPLHMNITEGAAPLIKHLVQHANERLTLKQLGSGQAVIGGGWEAVLTSPDRIVQTKLESIIGNLSLAQHIVPQLATLRVIRTWAGVNTSIDGLGVVGPLSGFRDIHFALPSDSGYTLGPITGNLAAELVLGKSTSEDVSTWSADRFAASS